MNNGVLIFAHNSQHVDYALMSVISGNLAKKYLKVPVSLVVDKLTVEWMIKSNIYEFAREIFDQLILIDRNKTNNYRTLYDGTKSKLVPFINFSRSYAWDLTPYDRTLLIDSDFLIFTNNLNKFWDVDEDVLISKSINDISCDRLGYHDRYISDTGVHLYWATTIMFTKSKKAKLFFDLVKHIKNNYQIFGDLFRFSTNQFRNDIAFSVAKHILNGFETVLSPTLPSVLTTFDKDVLVDVKDERLIFLINAANDETFAVSIDNNDIHIMNKQSVIRNSKKLLDLV